MVKEALTDSKWIADVDYNMNQKIIAEFISLWVLQETTLIPSEEDRITWKHTSDGQYSASSAYRLQFIGATTSMTAECTWTTKAPPKCRFFIWLML